MDHPYLHIKVPAVIAHRGTSGSAPENTFLAFQQASQLDGVDVLEMDVHLTKDGEIVVAHDPNLERISNGTGFIKETTLAELQTLDAGYQWTPDNGATYPYRGKGHTFSTLDSLFEHFPHCYYNIDLKAEEDAIVKPFVRLVQKYRLQSNVLMGSFHHSHVMQVRQLDPTLPTIASLKEVRQFYILHKLRLSRFFKTKAVAFQIPEWAENRQIVTPRFVKDLHKHNIFLHIWTVNEKEDMHRLLDWGVDGVISDYPSRFLEVIAER